MCAKGDKMVVCKKSIALTVIILLTLIALCAGSFIMQHLRQQSRNDLGKFHGTFLLKPREINQFSLLGIDNQPFDNSSLKGQWTMIFFGFTNCGHLCPTTMVELAKVYRQLEQDGIKELPKIVMITIDPERDDLEKLAKYVKAFNPHFYGARGSDEVIKQMTREMGVAYSKIELPHTGEENYYDVHHSGAVMLFNPKGELSAFFTTPHQARMIVQDYKLLVS